ncbi:sulfite exporter TauE/SafE family protein [Metabacillus lacus]|uniref:sulfite exporter TauE/SafE family protein n=1 Tax=Metabacillus lacus TaxID=1983721 RepID=UPI0012AFA912|nr:sulfite exporter TauE/SafE family protein [Metabacillus lacus]
MGLLIGVLSGFFGVGGGFILTPILLLMGYEPVTAITISLLYTIGTSFSGVFAHLRMKNIIWKPALLVAVSGVAATQFANPFVMFLKNRGYDELLIPVFYIVLLGYFAYKMLLQRKGREDELEVFEPSSKLLGYGVIGFIGGFLSTTLGVGGGFIIVPLLIAFSGFHPKKAVGTSLVSVLFIVAAGFLTYYIQRPIDLSLGFILIIGGLLGAQLGARATLIYKQKEIKLLLGVLYTFTMLSMIFKLFEFNMIGMGILAGFLTVLYIMMLTRAVFRRKQGTSDT